MKLAEIAYDMAAQAKRTGTSSRTLGRGLRLQLTWVAGTKTLVLARDNAAPGAPEIQICRDAFGVPPEAERSDGDNSITLRWPSHIMERLP